MPRKIIKKKIIEKKDIYSLDIRDSTIQNYGEIKILKRKIYGLTASLLIATIVFFVVMGIWEFMFDELYFCDGPNVFYSRGNTGYWLNCIKNFAILYYGFVANHFFWTLENEVIDKNSPMFVRMGSFALSDTS